MIRSSLIALALALPTLGHAAGIEWTGFGSAYLAKPFSSSSRNSVFPTGQAISSSLSLLGLNLRAPIESDITASAQLVASSPTSDRWMTEAKWAYLSYEPMQRLKFKVGRQVYPIFLDAENIDVKFFLPFNRIPDEVTSLAPYKGFDGLSAEYTYLLPSDLKLSVSVMGGRSHEIPGVQINAAGDAVGGTVGIVGQGWRGQLHASHSAMDQTGLGIYSAGASWDKYSILAQAEYVHTDGFGGSSDGYYGLVGYHYYGWTPRYSYAHADGSLLVDPTVITHDIGVNYQVSKNLLAKADFEIADLNGDNTTALFLGLDFVF